MIRGLVAKDRLLEWTVEDGWEPLCEFLGKDVPNEPFPHVNTRDKGWKDREARLRKDLVFPAMRKALFRFMFLVGSLLAIYIAYKMI